MVKIYKFFAYCLFFIAMLLFFLPKENLYYLLEQELAKKEVFISNEKLNEEIFGISLQDASVSYKGIEVAQVHKIRGDFLLFYNKISLQNIELSSLTASYFPSKVEDAVVIYSVLDPFVLQISAKGTFGILYGTYALQDGRLKIFLKPSKLFLKSYRRTLRYMKKSENGEYSYEKAL